MASLTSVKRPSSETQRPPQNNGRENPPLHLVSAEEDDKRERAESVAQLEREIKGVGKRLEVLWDKDFKQEAFELANDLSKVTEAKDQLSKLDFEAFQSQIEDLRLSLNALRGDVDYILKKQGRLEENGEGNISEEPTAEQEPKAAAIEAAAEPTEAAPAPEPVHTQTAIININKVRGEPRKKGFESGPRAVIDIPERLLKNILHESGAADNLFAAIVSGDMDTARILSQELMDKTTNTTEQELEETLSRQGLTPDQFRDKWRDGLYELVLAVIQDRVDAETRKQAVAEISLVDKLKVNWKGIAKKVAIVGGITAATATGFGAIFGGAAAIAAGVTTGGVVSRFFGRLTGKRREAGKVTAAEQETQQKMEALIEKKKKAIIDTLVQEWQGDEKSMSLLLSQAIREASAGDANVNKMIVQDALSKTAQELEANGEVAEAEAKELEGLIAGLGNLRETDPDLKKLIKEAESTPLAIEILKKIQEAKSGQLFIETKGGKKSSKIENVAGYLAPVAAGLSIGLAYTSRVSVSARVGMGAFGGGVAGYKIGEARDRAAKEKQVETETERVTAQTRKLISQYGGETPPAELTEEDLIELKSYAGKLKGKIEILSALQAGQKKSLLLTEAEAVVHEADRMITEIQQAGTLLEVLREQREVAFQNASADIKRINKNKGNWRRWMGLAAGAVLGGGLGFLGGEWAEHRQEVQMEGKLDELLKGVPADVKEHTLQSFAEPGHQVHDVEDLTFNELKHLMTGNGKALDVGLIQLKVTEVQGQEDLLHTYGLHPTGLDSLSLHDRIAALKDMAKTFGGWDKQGLDKEAIAAIGATGHGAKGPEADTINSLLAWNKAQGGHTAVMRLLNRDLSEPGVDVTKVLEHAVKLKDAVTGWEKSGLNADSIDAIVHGDSQTEAMVDNLLNKAGENHEIIAKFINHGLSNPETNLGDVLHSAGDLEKHIDVWSNRGLSKDALASIDLTSSGGIVTKVAAIDRLLAGAGGDPNVMHTINDHLENGLDLDTTLKSMLVSHGQGANSVTALIEHQLEANPSKYGFDSQKQFDDAIKWAQHEAAQLAIKGGYMNKDGTSHLGVVLQGKKDNFVFLTDDGKGHLGIKVTGKTYVMDESSAPVKHAVEQVPNVKTAQVNIRARSGILAENGGKAGNIADVAQTQSGWRRGGRGLKKAA